MDFNHFFLFCRQSIFCDNKLDELIDARDKWLAPNGLIFPDRCSLYIAALSNRHSLDRSNFWQHVHSFDMRPMIRAVNLEPYLQDVPLEQVYALNLPIFKSRYTDCGFLQMFSGCYECMSNQTCEYVYRWKTRLQTIRCTVSPRDGKNNHFDRCISHIFWYWIHRRHATNHV